MSDRKPSEVLRPYFADSGYLRPDKVLEYTEAVFAILDRLDAATSERVEKPDADEWPKWTISDVHVSMYLKDGSAMFWRIQDGSGPVVGCSHFDIDTGTTITHEQAVDLIPQIAKTHPLPTVKPPLTVEPARHEKVIKWCDGCVETISERQRETARADAAEARVRELETIIREYIEAAEKTLGTRTEGGGA